MFSRCWVCGQVGNLCPRHAVVGKRVLGSEMAGAVSQDAPLGALCQLSGSEEAALEVVGNRTACSVRSQNVYLISAVKRDLHKIGCSCRHRGGNGNTLGTKWIS